MVMDLGDVVDEDCVFACVVACGLSMLWVFDIGSGASKVILEVEF